ncbi:thiamine pyrophosphate-dependent dehydrogenase E1 component subunit alpha [Altererythrobacter sp. FM1]|uniref:Thiamine pyrophosphate-dependent dehydrogenase E1 component subunit alpha n=1 Tax=Tsuneonella flava TaxID=2055955 RepID=A0ABX7KE09_9SPHN|nr:thiamine pyrophosphate-dependent dehydrogenase E1 component subunit alpha [Tsuneonella flava]QSB45792.1 thiamine pyrophosphate-dependent dehydrogenase E1 component subunit alpha [Tsuneonella flava]ROT97330.1 thiamine pyrophosphate-dependent dehydrogenase E1 component subunit alpha [Altererythrobacter sp. FM1]
MKGEEGSPDRANDDIGEVRRLEMYRMQVLIRLFEERVQGLYLENLITGTTHLMIGQEAVSAGTSAAMRDGDLMFCTYRGHGHVLARGAPADKVLGEIMGRDNGLMRGKAGSMHLTSVEHGVMGSFAVIGSHLVLACGAAWRARYKGQDDVTVCVYGDGASNIGAFHEALNLAALWKLPVVFLCENNLYQEYSRIAEMSAVEHPSADRAGSYGLERIVIDGNDADVVFRAVSAAIETARSGGGPAIIEAMTYRQSGHSRADPAKYRPAGELDLWKERDPLKLYKARLRELGIEDDRIAEVEAQSRDAVNEATEACKLAPLSSPDLIMSNLWADGSCAWRN